LAAEQLRIASKLLAFLARSCYNCGCALSKFFAMKNCHIISAITLLILLRTGFAQSFVNLNFESADVSGYAPNSSNVPISKALPGWTGTYGSPSLGTNKTDVVWYDGAAPVGALISVDDTNVGAGSIPISGDYSAFLFSAGSTSATISQTGLIPVGTMSLQVKIVIGPPHQFPVVTLDGQAVRMFPLETFSNYTLYGGDASPFADQVAPLSITAALLGSPYLMAIDDIVFSPAPIPEPSGSGLFGIGTLLLGFFRRRNSSQ
jgi:PEP-CTERM motif